MSKISQDAIEYFNKRIEVENQIIQLPTCDKEVAELKKKHIEYMELAISDRQKLEKIEQIINRSKDCLGCFGNCEGCGNERYPEIEQIIRGGKNEID